MATVLCLQVGVGLSCYHPSFMCCVDHPVWSYGTFQLYVLSARLPLFWKPGNVMEFD